MKRRRTGKDGVSLIRGVAITALTTVALLLPSCTSVIPGEAYRSAAGASVALMDTGVYPTTSAPPFGTVGDNVLMQKVIEAERLADFVTGPWQVDSVLTDRGSWLETMVTGPQATSDMLRDNLVLTDPLPAIADAHGFITGFSSQRFTGDTKRGLRTVVLMFPDAAAASAAAKEMAEKNVVALGAGPGQKVAIDDIPEAMATSYEYAQRDEIHSFTPHGRFVLMQLGYITKDDPTGWTLHTIVKSTLDLQRKRIDQFVPTAPDALPELPFDPSGRLLAQTLWAADDGRQPYISGVWNREGWLHFEDNPTEAAAVFRASAVGPVGQRLATVYQTPTADDATRMFGEMASEIAALRDVELGDAVPGLPVAQCFSRPRTDGVGSDATESLVRVAWTNKCIAHADQFVFTTYSMNAIDAMQQISAQYRILAGE